MSQAASSSASLPKEYLAPVSGIQAAGADFLAHNPRAILADPRPEDRRITALAALYQLCRLPAVILSRGSDRPAWEELIHLYLGPDIPILDGKAVSKDTPANSIWILGYGDLKEFLELRDIPWPFAVIIDHAHLVKDWHARRTRLATRIARRAGYRFLLIDFPVNLSLADLRQPLEILGYWEDLDSLFEDHPLFGDLKLKEWIEQAGPDPLDIRMTPAAAREYQRQLRPVFPALRSLGLLRRVPDPGRRYQFLTDDIRLAAIPERIDPAAVFSELRRLGLMKAKAAIAWLQRKLKNLPGKTLILVHHNDLAEELAAKLNLPVIYGKVSSEEQRSVIAAALSHPDGPPALILSSDIELTWPMGGVNSLVFVELLVTPRQLHGMVEHILGQDQTRTLDVYLLVSDHELDIRAMERLMLRLDDYRRVLDGESGK